MESLNRMYMYLWITLNSDADRAQINLTDLILEQIKAEILEDAKRFN